MRLPPYGLIADRKTADAGGIRIMLLVGDFSQHVKIRTTRPQAFLGVPYRGFRQSLTPSAVSSGGVYSITHTPTDDAPGEPGAVEHLASSGWLLVSGIWDPASGSRLLLVISQ